MRHLLDNIFWHALAGAQASFATGTHEARRYARGFSPILGFASVLRPNFKAMLPWCAPDEHFYCDGWSGPVPPDWQIEHESTMFKMVWDAPLPSAESSARPVHLSAEHAAQALTLATLTRPGPFGLRTIELGDYFGWFEEGRLVAMAGERAFAEPWREISGVCTHPDVQGRGLGTGLMLHLIRRQMQRGETPFLHVTRENVGAHAFYRRMGFRDCRESVVRVVSLR